MSMTAAEVLEALFEKEGHSLYPIISAWVINDRRFRTFAERYHGKIRRKLRNAATDAAALADLQFELEIGRWLAQDARFEVEYEAYEARQGGTDYTVAYRVNTRFNVEVRRIRARETGDERVRKLTETLVDKSRQMPPTSINLLVMTDGAAPGDDLAAAGTALRNLAERKVEAFFEARGYKSASEFLKQYRQMSAVAFLAGESSLLWNNSLAKYPLPKDLALTLQRLLPLSLPPAGS
jgi:hypothetical protein